MRILFMGTPDFAVGSLKALVENNYDVIGVVTQPDKPKGRGHKMLPPPVKEYAQSINIATFQPETLRNNAFYDNLKELNPDIIIVVAYGKILPKYILDYPMYGCINVHASLLPKYRGAAPIQWSIVNGEKTTGVTTMYMNEGLDTGDMLIKNELAIDEDETASSLHDKLANLGAKTLIETMQALQNNSLVRTQQDHSMHTYAPMINKETAKIDFGKTAFEIRNLVRGMNSYPLAYTYYKGEIMKVIDAEVCDEQSDVKNGTILDYVKNKGILVKCSDKCLFIRSVQFQGGKKMSVDDYIKGHSIDLYTILGE